MHEEQPLAAEQAQTSPAANDAGEQVAALQAQVAELQDQYIRAQAEVASNETLREGTQLTLNQLLAALERSKVLAIAPAAGEKFDPHLHQAISMVPAEQEANTVVSVLQKGYTIADRILRPALVTVAAPK